MAAQQLSVRAGDSFKKGQQVEHPVAGFIKEVIFSWLDSLKK
jgi:hypothetical protein